MTTKHKVLPDIGTTNSGKPVHDVYHEVYQTTFYRKMWNIKPNALEEPSIMENTLPGWTRQDHKDAAKLHQDKAVDLNKMRMKLLDTGYKKYGPHDISSQMHFISGGLQEHWPKQLKDKIRDLAHRETAHKMAARSHLAAKWHTTTTHGRY